MTRPVLLDLFCGAGGAAVGYYRAGFDVVGVDIKLQPRYPFAFVQADALEYLGEHWLEFDAFHASPPCQRFSALRTMPNVVREYPDLIAPVRFMFRKHGRPWVIENVPGAPLQNPVCLCGTMFNLRCGSRPLYRHRMFECSFGEILTPPHDHRSEACIGVYGHSGGRSSRDGTPRSTTAERRVAMGIDWMTGAELSQAIPPAYTEFIGHRLMQELEASCAPSH